MRERERQRHRETIGEGVRVYGRGGKEGGERERERTGLLMMNVRQPGNFERRKNLLFKVRLIVDLSKGSGGAARRGMLVCREVRE